MVLTTKSLPTFLSCRNYGNSIRIWPFWLYSSVVVLLVIPRVSLRCNSAKNWDCAIEIVPLYDSPTHVEVCFSFQRILIIFTQPCPHLKKNTKTTEKQIWRKKQIQNKIIQKQLLGVHIDLKTVKKQLKFGLTFFFQTLNLEAMLTLRVLCPWFKWLRGELQPSNELCRHQHEADQEWDHVRYIVAAVWEDIRANTAEKEMWELADQQF